MRIWKLGQGWFFLALVALGVACGADDKPAAGSASASTNLSGGGSTAGTPKAESQRVASEAQPKLRTLKLWIGSEEMITEIAISQKEIETGMMHRVSMAENEGMLFVFPVAHQTAFWMKNTLLPLSCAYIDPEGVILEEHDMYPHDETPIKAATDRVQFVLETKQGWFERHKVAPGTVIRTERGSLQETFFRPQR